MPTPGSSKRRRKALRTLEGCTGRVRRGLRRQLAKAPAGSLRERAPDTLVLVCRPRSAPRSCTSSTPPRTPTKAPSAALQPPSQTAQNELGAS